MNVHIAKRIIAFAALTFVCLFQISCTKTDPTEEPVAVAIATPAPVVSNIGFTTATIHWAPCNGAAMYRLYLRGESDPIVVFDTTKTITRLSSGKSYAMTMKAFPAQDDKNYKESALCDSIYFTTSKTKRLKSPSLSSKDIYATEFTIHWAPVDSASVYEYYLSEFVRGFTADTLVRFTSLVKGTSYYPSVRAFPAEKYQEMIAESDWSTIEVVTCDIKPIDAPELVIKKDSWVLSQIVWEPVEGALEYEYHLENGSSIRTPGTSATFEHLTKDSVYTAFVRTIPAETRLYSESDWAKISWKAKDNAVSSLTISNPVATDLGFNFQATIKNKEYYLADIVPLSNWLKDGEIDTLALRDSMVKALNEEAARLVEEGTYATLIAARASLCHSSSKTISASHPRYEIDYLCYGIPVDVEKGESYGNVLTLSGSTPTENIHPADSVGIGSDDFRIRIHASGKYGSEYQSLQLYADNLSVGTRTYTSVKYAIIESSSSILKGDEKTIRKNISKYDYKLSMSAANLSKFNEGSLKAAFAGDYSLDFDKKYTAIAIACTEDDTIAVATSFKTYRDDADWLIVEAEAIDKTSIMISVSSEAKVVSGKYGVGILTGENDTRELQSAFFLTKGAEMSESKISGLNGGEGFTMLYQRLSSNRYYNAYITVTDVNGRTVVRNVVIKTGN